MTHPGSDFHVSGQQPGQAPATWAAPQQPATEPEKKGAKKWLPVVGSVVVAGGLGAYALTGGFGLGDPEIGDCVRMQGDTSFEVVDCTAGEAEYKIVGVEKDELNYAAFMKDPESCAEFKTAEMALWIGELETEPGTVYCAAAV